MTLAYERVAEYFDSEGEWNMDENRAPSVWKRGGWALAAAGTIFAVGACSSSKTTTPGPSATTVSGVVTDSSGAVLPGVAVSAGSATTTTAANGTFSLSVAAQSNLVVDFSKSGYLETSKALTSTAGTASHVSAALMAMAAMQPLDATMGGSVMGARGASLTAGPAALVDPTGNPVTGMVQVALTPLSPSVPGELAAYPGALVGSTTGGAPSLLQTYGVLSVTAMQNGQELQVAPGQTVTVTIPVVATGTTPLPPTQDLWSFNLATGTWDHEGTAQLVGTAYTAQLSHFSYHNIDAAIVMGEATCVTGLVVDKSGKPVAGARVSPSEGASVDTLLTTDSSGRYCTWVLTGGSELLTADSTSAPFGEGSINVTAGASASFPSSYPYTCSNLACSNAPNIVLDQPPCTTDMGCPSDDTCCMVGGEGMCLEAFACAEATGSYSFPGLDASIPSFDGSIPSGGGGCAASSGAITANLGGQTITFDCYASVLVQGAFEATGRVGADDAQTTVFVLEVPDASGLSAGDTLALGSDAGIDPDSGQPLATLLVTSESSTDVLECSPASGSVTFGPWSSTTGATVGFAIANGTQLNCTDVNIGDASFNTITGTISGTVTVPLL